MYIFPPILGPPGHLPILRRSLDLPDQGCLVQAGQPDNCDRGQGEDRELQQQAAWRGVTGLFQGQRYWRCCFLVSLKWLNRRSTGSPFLIWVIYSARGV